MPRKKSAAKKAREAAAKTQGEVPEQKISEEVEAKPLDANDEHEDASDESSSEEEDDYGELLTEEVEDGIKNVLTAIRNNEKDKLLNPEVKFFEDPEKAAEKMEVSEKHKPVYLKDYHRMNILSGNALKDDDELDEDELETVDGKQSFVSQQREERQQLLNEINNAFDGDDQKSEEENDDEDDDGFLKKKEKKMEVSKADPLREIDPNKDEDKFLEEFVNQHAWIPKKGDKIISLDGGMDMEEDDEEFDDAVEQFENAYNFRYEDPNAAEIVSYARTQATLRRSKTSSRRRKREEEKSHKEEEKKEKEESNENQ